ncbi:GNAT family N-acetyltransferase [Leadbetterella byssophila]|uniref:GCN5-related N-acetyltransferase n=1 Tax=Leadbetterella byssophila (strain DSM 17132 / JCM 16389 / KACC 11308 / NBRC 106382 / 4M15) TaxID=649349 RepID=E4RTM8_LEAB4|nr:GNAT family N-acetyltransferase [Leadbetterella byssophila]ADQ16885.1 GCN5-related N-acetyltransferase [Leadbetterella byssophila DSM 17132]
MTIACKPFDHLSIYELYDILALRSEVFVVEQNCPYQDPDGKDQKALHCIGRLAGKIAAYTRIFDINQSYEGYLSIGRVIVNPEFRKMGLGKTIMEYSILQCRNLFGNHPIKIGAQLYLDKFYRELGFVPQGEPYMEDGIPHQIMILI